MTVADLKWSNFSLKTPYALVVVQKIWPDRRLENTKSKRANAPNGDKVWYIVGRPNSKRIRAWFKTKEAAQAEATERNLAMRKLGEKRRRARRGLSRDGATRLKPFGKTLKDAIDFYLSHLIALQSSISARELESRIVARFDRRMRAGEISTRYLESIKGDPREVRREIRERVNRLSERR